MQHERTKDLSVGSSAWLELLARCVDSIGLEEFPGSLVRTIRSLVKVDFSVSFAYYETERPLCLFHTFEPGQRAVFVDDYLKGPYLLDPFFTACGRKVETGLYRLRDIAPDRFYQSEYYRSYYIQTGLAEELCYTFYLPRGVAVVVSLMRSGDSSRFSAREFRILEGITPIVVSLAQRHWRDMPEKFRTETAPNDMSDDQANIESTVARIFEPRITPREIQVVAQVLEGHSSEAIAKNLGISAGTVRIHRRNTYAKLRISSQQELFSIFFKNVTADR
ncbi:MAG: helix-turn-helix transcriptional regulator [Hyphomicrobiales bacterium]|nr:helix-turn-helix transcriptional regulator [Hyphomicrobiales bacterium]